VPPKECGHQADLWYPALLVRHIRSVAEAEGHPRMATVSETRLRKIMRDARVRPWRVTYYCERRDEDFDSKAHDVLVVYKQLSLCLDDAGEVWAECVDAEGRAVHTVSVDEKPGIQAIATTGEDRPPVAGGDARGRPTTVQRDHEYVRHGTLSLICGIDLLDGVAHPLVRPTHKSSDFVDFLRQLDARYPKGDAIRLVLDNHSAHTSAETQAYLNAVPGRFTFVFVPKHASWLNLVESFFGRMSRQMLRGIRVGSAEELKRRIYQWFDEFNEDPSPYRWTWGLDGIDMDDEDPRSIGYQVVNAKACRPEDAGKPAPPRPKRKPRRKAKAI
jgi:transposase